MALINKDTQEYYKINFDECKIKGNKVYANYFVYKTGMDREKDKQRLDSQIKFYQKLRSFINDLQTKFDIEISSHGINPYEEKDNFSKLTEEIKMKLHYEADNLNKYFEIERILPHKFYIVNNETSNNLDISNEINNLYNMGFMMEWVNDPIHLGTNIEVCCGEYNGEPIEPTLYYEKLKSVINSTLENC